MLCYECKNDMNIQKGLKQFQMNIKLKIKHNNMYN